MKIRKVTRKIALSQPGNDKIEAREVEAYVLPRLGKRLFTCMVESGRWSVFHSQTGTVVSGNFVNRKHALSFMKSLYRRASDWGLGIDGEFGRNMIVPPGTKRGQRLHKFMTEVTEVYQFGNVLVKTKTGEKTVGLGEPYCMQCGNTKRLYVGKFVVDGLNHVEVVETTSVTCSECGGERFAEF